MRQVAANEAHAGAILAEPIRDHRGRVLLKAGKPLTPTLIACLERWTIATIFIEDGEPESVASEASENETQLWLNERWEKLFEPHLDCPEMQTIHQALRQWLTTRQSQQETPS